MTIKQGEKVELPDMVGDTDGIISDSTSYTIDNPAIAAFNCAEGNRSMILGEKPGETTLFAHVNATKIYRLALPSCILQSHQPRLKATLLQSDSPKLVHCAKSWPNSKM